MNTTPTLTCKECGHPNESQRIYCHNCGVKLDRSILPPEETPEETREEVQKRVQKLVTIKRGFWAGSWKSALETIITALVVAVLIQAGRAPDDIPPLPKKGEINERPMIPMLFSRAMAEMVPQRITIQEATANNYLMAAIKPMETGVMANEFKFIRTYVHFKKGLCEIYTHQSVFDYPIYACVAYQIQIADNKVQALCTGGQIGRMPIHPALMRYADLVFQNLWKALERERKLIDQMHSVEVKPEEIVFETKPARRF